MARKKRAPKPAPTVEVPHSSYQPNAQELKDDLRLKGTFKDAIKALVSPAKIRQVMPHGKR